MTQPKFRQICVISRFVTDSADRDTYRFMHCQPRFGRRVYVSPRAEVSGSVALGDEVSVWPMAVIRGDVNHIEIGPRCNIQDGAVLHVTHEGPWTPGGGPLTLKDDITVGHAAILHACTIGHRCLVGMGAIVMDGAVLEDEVMIAAGSVVTPGTRVPARTLWKGNPAREARALSADEVAMLRYSAEHYVRLKDHYLAARSADQREEPGRAAGESG